MKFKFRVLVFILTGFILFPLFTSYVSADTNVSGSITSDTVWESLNSPYIVTDDISVSSGIKLTIEPGVTVRFESGKKLTVAGELVARGTDTNKIIFTSNHTSPALGDWNGIVFTDTSVPAVFDNGGNYTSGSIIQYAVVEYAGSGGLDAPAIYLDKTFIDHNVIRNSAGPGLLGGNGATVTNNTIASNQGAGIIPGGNGTIIDSNTIENNSVPGGLRRGAGISVIWNTTGVTISNNLIRNNGSGGFAVQPGGILSFGSNPLITGNTIQNNSGDAGGIEVYIDNGDGLQSFTRPTISKNIIINNAGHDGAGGIHLGRDGFNVSATVTDNTISDNQGGGVTLSDRGSVITLSNNIIDNNQGAGVNLSRVISGLVIGNKITNNAGVGLSVTHHLNFDGIPFGPSTISENLIALNNGGGVSLDVGFLNLSCNTIVGNGGSGVILTNIPSISTITSTIENNNFGSNNQYDFIAPNRAGATIAVGGNWWGTVNTSQIDTHIDDSSEDAALATIGYTPTLAEPSSCAPQYIYPNTSPVVSPLNNVTINMGQTYSVNGSFTDTDSSTSWTATVDYADGTGEEPLILNSDKTFSLSHQYSTAGTYNVTVAVRDNQQATGATHATVTVIAPTPSPTPTATPTPRQITSLNPAKVWVGLQNSNGNGIRYDLKAEAYKNGVLISSGELDSVDSGGTGFNNANLHTIPFNSFSPLTFPTGSQLSIQVSVRNSCTNSKNNGKTARLWYDDAQANSGFGATIGASTSTYFLYIGNALGTTTGTGPKQTVDVSAGAECSAFKPFGTWSITL